MTSAHRLSARERWALETVSRQFAVVTELERMVTRAVDPVKACTGWLAVHRQASRHLRYLAPWVPGAGFDGALPQIDEYRHSFDDAIFRSAAALARFDEATASQARQLLGLRVAFIGKGGAGKTVLASTLARVLSRRGRRVLAADLDTNPGMAITLGFAPTEAGLPLEALEEREGANYGWQLASGLSPGDVVDRFSQDGPDGVRFLGIGKIATLDKLAAKRSVAALIQTLLGFGIPGWDVVGDLEAGPTTPFERYHAFADDVLVVVGPSWQSALTARRLLPIVAGCRTKVVANRFTGEPDHAGLRPWARVPFDACVAGAERDGASPFEACPDSPAVRAIEQLADRLVADAATG